MIIIQFAATSTLSSKSRERNKDTYLVHRSLSLSRPRLSNLKRRPCATCKPTTRALHCLCAATGAVKHIIMHCMLPVCGFISVQAPANAYFLRTNLLCQLQNRWQFCSGMVRFVRITSVFNLLLQNWHPYEYSRTNTLKSKTFKSNFA